MATCGILLWVARHLLFPRQYKLQLLAIGAALWMLIALVRLWRTPISTLMQAAGAFRPLAIASVNSAIVSVVAVIALLLMKGTIWSLVGVLSGELTFAGVAWLAYHRWLTERRPVGLTE